MVGLGEPTLALVEVGVADVVGTVLLFPGLLAQLITEQSAADTAEGPTGQHSAHACATTAVTGATPIAGSIRVAGSNAVLESGHVAAPRT